jgi:hypothetical protein
MAKTRAIVKKTNSIQTVDPQSLISQAIAKNLPIETMEKLLAMRRELKAEMARDAYFADLALFQKACPIIEKTKRVHDKGGKLRYKYAPLESIILQIRDLLEQYGFSYTIKTEQDKDSVTAICVSHHKLGHSEETRFRIPIDHKAFMNAAQKVASALTYAKRYAFCDAFGIMTGDEDDDANITDQEPGEIKLACPIDPDLLLEFQDLLVKIKEKMGADSRVMAIDKGFSGKHRNNIDWIEKGIEWMRNELEKKPASEEAKSIYSYIKIKLKDTTYSEEDQKHILDRASRLLDQDKVKHLEDIKNDVNNKLDEQKEIF